MVKTSQIRSPLRIFLSLGLAIAFAAAPPVGLSGADDSHASVIGSHTPVKMTLADAVLLALQHNIDLQSAYIGRTAQRMALRVAEDKFVPQPALNFTVGTASTLPVSEPGSPEYPARKQTTAMNGEFAVSLNIPTGGAFTFAWDNPIASTDTTPSPYSYGSSWSLNFTQPLLKNSGMDVNTASVQIARITEEQNILSLKNTITTTIVTTITAYRAYVNARGDCKISENALVHARQLLEYNHALIAAGRMAEKESIQAESGIANWEFGVVRSKNALDQARLELLETMNIDRNTQIEPVAESDIQIRTPSFNDALKLALAKRNDYLQAVKQLDIANLNMKVAKRLQLWNLSFTAGFNQEIYDTNYGSAVSRIITPWNSNWLVGLTLNIPLRDLPTKQQLVQADVSVKQQELAIKKLTMTIETAVQNAIRNVKQNYIQTELARQARILMEQKLAVELEKLHSGRTTNFQIVTFQNDLWSSQQQELSAWINYHNSLTSLDAVMGTTLDTWRIDVDTPDEGKVSPFSDADPRRIPMEKIDRP